MQTLPRMTISWFVAFADPDHPEARVSDADRAGILAILRGTPGMLRAHLFTPGKAGGPFQHDGPPPRLGLQVLFADIQALEAALGPDGHLQALATTPWPSLAGTEITHQAMLTRAFAVPQPNPGASDSLPCSFLVHYPGHADDLNAWLRHYITHHPQIMTRFPGIREIQIFTRIDWYDSLPWPRVHHMQRNKLVFDSPQALTAALESPVIRAMRADFHQFPPFHGGNIHHPLLTHTISGQPLLTGSGDD